jgi:hypothetical protein
VREKLPSISMTMNPFSQQPDQMSASIFRRLKHPITHVCFDCLLAFSAVFYCLFSFLPHCELVSIKTEEKLITRHLQFIFDARENDLIDVRAFLFSFSLFLTMLTSNSEKKN